MRDRCVAFVCLWVAACLGAAAPARAGCNTIPPAGRTFGSVRGFVDRSLASPRELVTVTLEPQCLPSPLPAGERDHFDQSDVVTLVFEATGGTALPPLTFPAANVDASNPKALRFRIPDTTFAGRRDFGVAGPATILVTDTDGVTVAKIGTLYQPSTGCDQVAETVFGHFTILPEPNVFEDKASKDDFVLMTLDEDGDLLIPFRHPQRPVSTKGPAAHVEHGSGAFLAFSNDPKKVKIGKALADAKLGGAKDWDLAQAFTLEGHPLPPLLGVDADGALFGSVDAETSVIRVVRAGNRFDLADQRTPVQSDTGVSYPGLGPIVMRHGASKMFQVARCPDPVLMSNLHSTGKLTLLTVDEKMVGDQNGDGDTLDVVGEILNAKTAGGACATSTKTAIATASTGAGQRPLVDAAGGLAAVVRDDGVLRAFRPDGKEVAKHATPIVCRTPGLNGASLVAADPLVFFREQPASGDPMVKVLDTFPQPTVISPSPAIGQREAIVDREHRTVASRPMSGAAQFYEADTDTSASLGLPADQLDVDDHVVAMLVPETATPGLGNDDGDTSDRTVVFALVDPPTTPNPTDLGVAADMVKLTSDGTTKWLLFRTPESDEGKGTGKQCTATAAGGCDLTGDGDSDDRVLRVRNLADGTTTIIGAADDFVASGPLVAFRAPVAGETPRMTVYDLATNQRIETGLPALRCNDLGYEWMSPYGIRGRTLFFVSEDAGGKRVLVTFHVDSFATMFLAAAAADAPLPPVAVTTVGGAPMLALQTADGTPLTLFGDRDGDGVFDSFDRCIDVADRSSFDDDLDGLGTACDPDLCTPFRIPASPRVANERTRADVERIVAAGAQYLQARLRTSLECLARLSVPACGGASRSEATRRCRGYVVGTRVVPPSDPATARAVADALDAFLPAFEPLHSAKAASTTRDEVVRGFTEAAIAISHAAFGDATAPHESPCTTALVDATTTDVESVLAAVTKLAAGAPAEETIVAAPGKALALSHQVALEAPRPIAACGRADLVELATCGDDPVAAARCLRCVALRRAVDAIAGTHRALAGLPTR